MHKHLGTCLCSTAVIGTVSVRIRHFSADAGTPFLKPEVHHCGRNTILKGIGCRSSQGYSLKLTNARGAIGGGVGARLSSSMVVVDGEREGGGALVEVLNHVTHVHEVLHR